MSDLNKLHEISQAAAIEAAAEALRSAHWSVALPDTFMLHDLERLQPFRRRARGAITLHRVSDFAAYLEVWAEPGAMVFVGASSMRATAVLNLGVAGCAGHVDHTAVYSPRATAAHRALLAMTDGKPHSPREVAEWLEDWGPEFIICSAGDASVSLPTAVSQIRRTTPESIDRAEVQTPTRLVFSCTPYAGFTAQQFLVRMVATICDRQPAFVLRVVQMEHHQQSLLTELVQQIEQHVPEIPVMVGGYAAAA